ncbi:hypothetical protein C8R45DRAFT_1073053 [Mycena sanguinolenta]|nr:hypothetical protein C8R45DRAFT_1073053 [Mycena sanguinolenta]
MFRGILNVHFDRHTPLLSSPPYTPSLFYNFLLECSNGPAFSGLQRLPGFIGDYHPDVSQSFKQPLFLDMTDLQGRPGPRHCLLTSKTYVDAGIQTEPSEISCNSADRGVRDAKRKRDYCQSFGG